MKKTIILLYSARKRKINPTLDILDYNLKLILFLFLKLNGERWVLLVE